MIDAVRDGGAEHAVRPFAPGLLRAPAVCRPRIACAAGNYAAHTAGAARRKGVESTMALSGLADSGPVPSAEEIAERTRARGQPRGFWKDFALPAGPEDPIRYPARFTRNRFDYEGEVAVVLAGPAKDVPARQWRPS